MRISYLAPVLLAACGVAGNDVPAAPAFTSVHDRLTTESTRLFIPGEAGAGSLVARRYTHDGWVEGTAALAIANGELVAQVAGDRLMARTFELGLDPIDVPETVFGKPAQLTDVRLTLASSSSAPIEWTDENDATARLDLELDLQWSIAIDGSVSPLGTQHLPSIPLDVTLSGGGDHVDAALGIHASGTLWSWADLLELDQLDLELAAGTID